MDTSFLPIIRFEVEGVKAHIASMLGLRGSEMMERISAEVDKAVANYDLSRAVTAAVSDGMRKAVNDFFTYGEGYKRIQAAVEEGFNYKERQ